MIKFVFLVTIFYHFYQLNVFVSPKERNLPHPLSAAGFFRLKRFYIKTNHTKRFQIVDKLPSRVFIAFDKYCPAYLFIGTIGN